MYNPTLRAAIFEQFPEVRFAFSMKREPLGGGEKDVSEAEFLRSLGVNVDSIAMQKQIHSSTVKRVTGPGTYPDCDALITDSSGLFLRVAAADCMPVFLYDPRTRAVGAVHSGWRGCVGGLVQKTLLSLRKEFSLSLADVRAFVGPSARTCCYEIGPEVAALFGPDFLVAGRNMRPHLDMQRHAVSQLTAVGVLPSHIEVSPYCTVCAQGLFHSYRRDRDRAGRNIGVIGIRE